MNKVDPSLRDEATCLDEITDTEAGGHGWYETYCAVGRQRLIRWLLQVPHTLRSYGTVLWDSFTINSYI